MCQVKVIRQNWLTYGLNVVCTGKDYDLIMNSPIAESEKELKTLLMRLTGRIQKLP